MGNIDTLAPNRIMKRERVHTATKPRVLSEKAKALIKVMEREHRERKEALERSTQPCPIDGKESKYFGTTGSYQIVVSVYLCPDGHKFSWRPDAGSKILVP